MKIIIVGAGQVGGTLAETLAREYNDVTLIDIDEGVLRGLQDRLDVRTVVGTGSYPDVLVQAGIEDADMLVAVTSSDEINITACQVAYSLFQTPTKIARVRAHNYTNPKYKSILFNDKNMPVDVMIAPEQAVTHYIRRLIEQPGALQVLDFADGVLQLVGLRAVKDSPLVGQELRTLKEHIPKADARVAALYRKDRAISPVGDTVIEDGDEVFFIAAKKNIRKVMSELRRLEKPYHRLVIAGGGNTALKSSSFLPNEQTTYLKS
jgi:trk system potassium uptake protein TrkA